MNQDNFFSIERLVEFGLGVAVAQQMTQSMNSMLRNTPMPTVMNQAGLLSLAGHYFVVIDGGQAGPFSAEDIARLIIDGKVTKGTYVWKPGMAQWNTAENVPEVLKIVALTPPPFIPGD